ncbi:serine hydrolase domain-containing protein [Stigmatella hybrida]|uniref:serine hydrolase domain-containing protein n=1 Tax=Stigmatella hybrida TaxID=394097 RepID=UPI001CDAFE2F|nr:serine hydrolase domain-containing protein [Stigmatella hybrida]
MKDSFLVAAALFVTFSLLTGCTGASSSVRASRAPDAHTVDSLFASYDGPDLPGASVTVIHEGRAVFSRAYGLAELSARIPATPQTHYRLASLSKQFTAMAIMRLVEEGKLRYDDLVARVLTGFPAHAGEVRIRHLLNHTSGLWEYEAFVPDTQTVQVTDRDVLELVSRASRTHFPPGTAVRYSNSGYALLALIVEQISGMPFARFLRERVFAPSGMRSAVAHEEGLSAVPQRAYGYVASTEGFRPRDQSPTSAVLGDGGIYASVEELVAWDRALDTHALVSEATQRLAWTAPALPDGTSARYGFGWFVDDDGGRLRLSHHGETSGFTNAIVKYPEQRLTVIVLTNRAGGEPWRIAQQVADLWLGTPGALPWPFETFPASR